jgi:copper(I)-binding protein
VSRRTVAWPHGRTVLSLLLAGAVACGRAAAPAALVVRDARAFEAKQGGAGAAYGTIINGTDSAEVLDSVTSPVSRFVSAHAERETNGFVTMTPLDRPAIAAHDSLVFAPGGDHLMLESLERDLPPGDHLPLTFWFHRAGPISVSAKVTPYGS